jgi:hypothetical protein
LGAAASTAPTAGEVDAIALASAGLVPAVKRSKLVRLARAATASEAKSERLLEGRDVAPSRFLTGFALSIRSYPLTSLH